MKKRLLISFLLVLFIVSPIFARPYLQHNKPLSGFQLNPAAAPNIVGYWPMSEGGGFTVQDLANGNHGLIDGATWVGGGLSFDGDDLIDIGDTETFKFLHGALNPSSFEFTVSGIMQLDNPEPNAAYGLFSTGTGGSAGVGVDIFFDDRVAVGGRSRAFAVFITRGVVGQMVLEFITDNNVYPNDTEEHEITITYNQALGSENCKIYVDGRLVDTGNKTGNVPSSANSSNSLKLGALGSSSLFLTGKQKEFLVWDRCFSDAEVLFRARNPYALLQQQSMTQFFTVPATGGIPLFYHHYKQMGN